MRLVAAMAWCQNCAWTAEAKNAMGTAAIHHKKTGHYVIVETHYAHFYGKPKEPDKANKEEDNG